MKTSNMESYYFDSEFTMEGMSVQPVHVRIEKLRPVIAAHSHSQTSYEIHCTAQGSGAVTVGGARYPICKGVIFVTGPGVVHAQHSDPAEPVLEYCLYLDCRLLRQNKRANPLCKTFLNTKFWIGADSQGVTDALAKLIEEEKSQAFGYGCMAEAQIRRIIVLLTRTYRGNSLPNAANTADTVPTAASYYPQVEDGFFYGHQTLRLSELAEMLHLSKRQTQRFLKGNYGKTFTQKLTEARMSAAAQMLINTKMTISEIAEQTGFSSGEHFSTAFRRYYNQSPSGYRKENR